MRPPVRSWWKQERRAHPRSQVRKQLLLALLLLTAVLALHTDPSARQILEVIAGMPDEMPLHLVAEGVEDEEHSKPCTSLAFNTSRAIYLANPYPLTNSLLAMARP